MNTVNIRTALVVHLCLVAMISFILATGFDLFQSHRHAQNQAEKTADLLSKHLNVQLLRIKTGFDANSRFPDWEALLKHISVPGQCVTYVSDAGISKHGACIGVPPKSDVPNWFVILYQSLLGRFDPIERPLKYRKQSHGQLVITSDPKAIHAEAWLNICNMFGFLLFILFTFSILIYFLIGRALTPANKLVNGLERLSGGEFSYRLPRFSLLEFQRISAACNQLAHKIEGMLAERSDLSQRLVNAQEMERQALARELHDEFGQNLTAISALSASIKKLVQTASPEAVNEVDMLANITASMASSLRGTLLQLRPAELDSLGLEECLRQLVSMWNVTYAGKTQFELNYSHPKLVVEADRGIHIFRIAQEGLTNAARHANASTVRLTIAPICDERLEGRKGIEITIKDDGNGRCHIEKEAGSKGGGVLNMNERVAALGGSIIFDDCDKGGLTVCVTIPSESEASQ